MKTTEVLARVIAANEAVTAGDVLEAGALLRDLERELSQETQVRRFHACPGCGQQFRWPGDLDRHLVLRGHGLEEWPS
ncbi:MAG: hypothetical protein WKF41_06830 [Gaiellaceae bacterium]